MTNRKFPVSWLNVKLSEICQILDYKRVPVNNAERNQRLAGKNQDDIYPYYGATGIVGYIDGYLFDGEYLLVGEDGAPFLEPFKNKAYIVSGKFWVNNHAHIIEPLINNKFLLHYLNVFDYSNSVTGTTRLKLNQQALKEIHCLIPPLNEQHRIVTKIEELFSKIDKGIESLQKAKELLGLYRQSLLKHAFEGKLTEQWRKENPDKVVPADELLEQIKQARESRYQQQLEEWESAVKLWESEGKKGKKPSKPKLLENFEINSNELSALPKLPDGWFWIKAGLLYEFVTSGSRGWAKYYSDSGAIFVRITNLDFDSLELDLSTDKIQYVNPPDSAEGFRTKIQEGDFLFSITGYLGMFGIAPKLEQAYVNQHIALVRPFPIVNKLYFGYYAISKTGGNHYLNKLTKGAVKAGLTLEDIKQIPFPICSLSEQGKIVKELEAKISVINNQEQIIEQTLKQSATLKQSILKKAFSGQLVPQDPNDEPASVLLERIRAEKARAGCN